MTLASLSSVAALGVLVAVVSAVVGVREARGRVPDPGRPPSRWARRLAAARAELPDGVQGRYRWLAGAAGVVGLAVWAFTGWPVHGLVAAAAVLGLPYVLHPGGSAQRRIERLEALAQWLHHLSAVHQAGVTLAQTIQASVKSAPAPIADHVATLGRRLRDAERPVEAFTAFADDMADGVVDHIVLLFMTHSTQRGEGLSHALEALATTIGRQASDARDIEADRAKVRRSARTVSLFILGVVTVCMVNTSYTAPYGTAGGQILLAILAVAFGWLLTRVRSIARSKPDPRLLAPRPSPGPRSGAASAPKGVR